MDCICFINLRLRILFESLVLGITIFWKSRIWYWESGIYEYKKWLRICLVDNVYPPQKKSFSMMRYVHDHYVQEYEWFLRLDDDAYVHIEHLESLLRPG